MPQIVRGRAGTTKDQIFVILDGCPKEYENMMNAALKKRDFDIIKLDRAGNRPTFEKQIYILLNQRLSEYVYFAEDDYLYLPNSVEYGLDFMKNNNGVDFVSLNDHADYYKMTLHTTKRKGITYKDRYWRPVGSTCLTFLTNRRG